MAIALMLGLVVAAMPGCAAGRKPPAGTVHRGAPPSYAEVAASYNERVAPLDRLWARTVIRVWYKDERGEPRQDQLEGHLQFMRPDRLLLTFDKVGNTYAALGSNEKQYWWMETRENRQAWVGENAEATPELIAKLGLPVHPLNFIELLGITPLRSAESAGAEATVAWSQDGRSLVVTAPGRLGLRRLWLDPERWLPVRVEVLGSGGEVAIGADLSKYQPVAVRSPRPHWSPEVPSELEAVQPRDSLRVRMTLFDPETAGSRPKATAFDLDRLLKLLDINQVQHLGEPAPPPAAAAPVLPAPAQAIR